MLSQDFSGRIIDMFLVLFKTGSTAAIVGVFTLSKVIGRRERCVCARDYFTLLYGPNNICVRYIVTFLLWSFLHFPP